MATYTSTSTGGNWSAAGTWTTTPPTGGPDNSGGNTDLVVIASGAVVTIDSAAGIGGIGTVTTGAKASGIGVGITINGASSSSFGTLQVASGCTLTLRGYDLANNAMMLINQYGQFNPQPGSTILGDAGTDYGTIIVNKGAINAIGTSGSPITFSSPAAQFSWNNQITNESASGLVFDVPANQLCYSFADHWIANSAGTGLGSFGNSSLSFNTLSPSTILQTEVSALSGVTSAGDYYINYDVGIIVFYSTVAATFKATYKFGALINGWGIQSLQNAAYNSAVFEYCNFSYMGQSGATANDFAVMVNYKLSAGANSGAVNRLFRFTNNNVNFCSQFLAIGGLVGTSGDPILITNNTFNMVHGAYTYGTCIGSNMSSVGLNQAFVNINNNTINQRYVFFKVYGYATPTTQFTCSSFQVNNNTGLCPYLLNGSAPAIVCPDLQVEDNTIQGIGWAVDSRWMERIGGTSGHPVVVSANITNHLKRAIHYESYMLIDSNQFGQCYHHGCPSSTNDDVYITGVTIQNNLFYSNFPYADSLSPAIEMGYNHRQHIDSCIVVNNTIAGRPGGGIGFGDLQDTGSVTLVTNAVVVNNLAWNASAGGASGGVQGVARRADNTTGSGNLTRVHCLILDYGLYYEVTNQYLDINAGGTFSQSGVNYNAATSGRNLLGLALFSPTYASGTSSLSITYTCTTPGVTETLTLTDGTGAGAAVSIINSSGTCSAASTNSAPQGYNVSSTVTNSSATWSVVFTNAACPRCRWLKITGGTGSGQIRAITNNTATTLTVAPALITALDTTSTYVVYESEITLTGGSGSTANVGIDARVFPFGSTASDSGISYATHDAGNVNPLLLNPTGVVAVNYSLPGSGSPAETAGTSYDAPAYDYFGTTRPNNGGYDIGFMQVGPLLAATAAITLGPITSAGSGTFLTQASEAVTLGSLTSVGTATALAMASSTVTLGSITSAGMGLQGAGSAASITLAPISSAGIGFGAIDAAASIALAPLATTGLGQFEALASASLTLGSIISTASAGGVGVSIMDYADPRQGTILSADTDPAAVDPRQGTVIN